MNKLLQSVQAQHEDYAKKQEEHFVRVKSMIDWLEQRGSLSLLNGTSEYIGKTYTVDGVECIMVHMDARCAPYLNAHFDLRPMWSDGDLGEGCGNQKRYEF